MTSIVKARTDLQASGAGGEESSLLKLERPRHE